MRRIGLALGLICLAAAPVLAQDVSTGDVKSTDDTGSAGSVSMASLIQDGYEIKTATPSGDGKLIIFLQNEKSAYACEFTNLVTTRCGSIN